MAKANAPLSSRLRSLFSEAATASAGKLQLIGIEHIKERLGDRWERSRSQICASIERGLSNEVRAGDVFFKVDDLAYIVLFSDRTVAESKLVCAKVAQEVCRKLFGEDDDLVSLRSLTCIADKQFLLEDVDLEGTLDALLEEKGEEQLFTRRGAPQEPQKDPQPTEREISFIGPSGMPIAAHLSDLTFAFSPVWDVERRVVLTYLCRAYLPDTGEAKTRPQFLLTEDPDHQRLLDSQILHECVQRLSEIKDNQRRVLMICPVHWATLSRARYWADFRARFLAVGTDILQDLIVCVHGIDAGTPNIRLMQEFPKLTGTIRGIYACLSYGDRAVDRFVNTRISAIGFSLPEDISDERGVTSTAREFCVAADGKSMASFAFGVETRSLAMALIGTGFRFLEGSAIRPAVAIPRNAFVHETIDLFSSEFFG